MEEEDEEENDGRSSSSHAKIDLSIGLKMCAVPFLPALRGRGTPPTKTVLRGSSGREASRTKSASDNFHGRICTGLSWIKIEETSKLSRQLSCLLSWRVYLDCRRRNAQIQFIFFLHTRFDQLLDRVLFLRTKNASPLAVKCANRRERLKLT